MDKKYDKIQNLIIVTKENFHECFNDFKNMLNKKSLEYIIFNNEISTSNKKYIEKYGEIIFSEFTICYKGKEARNNKEQNNLFYITYLIPSLKYHKFSPEEFISFNPITLQSLSNYSDLYTMNNICKINSISYENINEVHNLERNFSSILKEGKPFSEENKKSYNFFPKAIELPSKKFQKKFEDIVKYLIELNFSEEPKFPFGNNDEYCYYKTSLYESNYKLLNRLLNFKWNLIFNNLEEDIYKIIVNGYKIKILKKKLRMKKDFISMITKLTNFFEDKINTSLEFEIDIEDKYFNNELLKNWKIYLESENKYISFIYNIKNEEKKVIFNIKIQNNKKKLDRFENITKFLKFIIQIEEEYNNDNTNKEFILDNIIYKRINMLNLFTEKVKKRIEFSYHIIPQIAQSKFKLTQEKEYYISKVAYKTLFIRNCNDEEILFGQKIKPYMQELFNIKKDDNGIKSFPIFYGTLLKNLLSFKKFNNEMKLFFSKFDFSIFDQKKDKFYSVHYNKNEKFNDEEFESYFKSILDLAKEIKKNSTINKEIGLSLFYKELFTLKNINLYVLNIKDNIHFAIKKLLLKQDQNNNDEINEVISKMNIYDLSLIFNDKKINFYYQYLNINQDRNLRNLPITQKIHMIIQKNSFFKNKGNFINYKNKFLSESNNINKNRPFYLVKKKKFFKKPEEIINFLKNKSDFTLTTNIENDEMIQINFIDSSKFNDLGNIINELNDIIF